MLDLIASQAPMIHEYTEAARVQWQASRHPQNIEEMQAAVRAEQGGNSKLAKAVLMGTTALIAVQTTINEPLLSYVGAESIDRFGNIGATFGAVGGTVAAIDGAIVLGTAYSIEKFRPAVQVAYQRYGRAVSEESSEGLNSTAKLKRAATVASMAFMTGGGSVVGYTDYKDNGSHMRTNIKRGLAATGVLAVGVGALGAAVHGGAAAAEAHGQTNAIETTVDALKVYLPALIAGGVTAVWAKRRWTLSRKVDAQMAESVKVEQPAVTKPKAPQSLFSREPSKNLA